MCSIHGNGTGQYVLHCSRAHPFARGARSYVTQLPKAWEMCCEESKERVRRAMDQAREKR